MVVGAGLVGATLALGLARAGRRVVVLEQRPPPAAGGTPRDMRGLVLAPASVELLERLGAWSALRPLATPIRHIEVSERGRFGTVRLAAAEAGLEALGWACPADHLLETLAGAAAEALGAAWHGHSRYRAHVVENDGVSVHADGPGGPLELRARLLVGADGAESSVRTAAGIGLDVHVYGQTAIVANLAVAAPRADTAFERFTRRGPIAFIPRGGARYVSVQCLDDATAADALALDDQAYLALLERRFGRRLGALSALGPRHAHALVRRRAERLGAPRLALVGNAAHTVHPNAAQGLNLGLRDVAALLEALAQAPDAGAPAVLDTYAAARVADCRRVLGFTDLLAQAFTSPLVPVGMARHAAMALLGCAPPLRRWLVEQASGLAVLPRGHDA